MPSLLMGCGNSRVKKVSWNEAPDWTGELVTMDMNPNCGADIIHDLDVRPLPFPDETFDEIAAYDVLEHLGRQGDWKGFFEEFAEYWRILKPGGFFGIIVPIGEDWHADPGHTRFFSPHWFRFLDQNWYDQELAKGQQVTDYRWFWKRDFEIVELFDANHHHIVALLRKR